MASIFKRRKGKNEPYTIQYLDHLGQRRTKKGFTDKGLSEQLAAKLESDARLRRTGMVDPEQERYAAVKDSPIEGHLETFKGSLAERSSIYIRMTMSRVRRILKECQFEKLSDIVAERVQDYLRSLRSTENLGARTYNHYLQAFDAFLNWCVRTKRLIANPLVGLERLNSEVDVRHPRRALSPAEVDRLIAATRKSGKRIQRMSPEQRARAYLFSYLTGLRKTELGSLTPASFRLDDTPATVTVAAASSKHRRKDVLPLHPELVLLLNGWLTDLAPGEKLFPGIGRKKLSDMIRKDLERAGIAYRTDEGIADFHAAGRHTYITQLLRNGATVPETRELARHSDVKMTMRYTHIGMDDRAKAVAKLPIAALQMRCISGGADGLSVAPDGSSAAQDERPNPFGHKNLDAACHCLALNVKAEGKGFEPSTDFSAPDFESVAGIA
jgi:integrase